MTEDEIKEYKSVVELNTIEDDEVYTAYETSSDHSFEEAVAALKNGKGIERYQYNKIWGLESTQDKTTPSFVCGANLTAKAMAQINYLFSMEDIFANDWIVYTKKEKVE